MRQAKARITRLEAEVARLKAELAALAPGRTGTEANLARIKRAMGQ
jgi:hypothetical protein